MITEKQNYREMLGATIADWHKQLPPTIQNKMANYEQLINTRQIEIHFVQNPPLPIRFELDFSTVNTIKTVELAESRQDPRSEMNSPLFKPTFIIHPGFIGEDSPQVQASWLYADALLQQFVSGDFRERYKGIYERAFSTVTKNGLPIHMAEYIHALTFTDHMCYADFSYADYAEEISRRKEMQPEEIKDALETLRNPAIFIAARQQYSAEALNYIMTHAGSNKSYASLPDDTRAYLSAHYVVDIIEDLRGIHEIEDRLFAQEQ